MKEIMSEEQENLIPGTIANNLSYVRISEDAILIRNGG